MKKIIFIICIFLIANNIYSQEDKIVELTTSASGKTKEEAIHNALRSAIEQAFGVFISSKTEILNDGLLTDQIIALSNGNIQQYEIISEIHINNNTEYAVSVKSKVSISKLTSFIESKGIEVEFKGSLFAMNIKQQKLNENSELKAIDQMVEVLKNISDNSFDFEVATYAEPTVNESNSGLYDIPLLIKAKLNSNFNNYKNYFKKTLSAISMTESEAKNYINLKKPIYSLLLRNNVKIKDTVIATKNIEDELIKLIEDPNNQIEIHHKYKYKKDLTTYYKEIKDPNLQDKITIRAQLSHYNDLLNKVIIINQSIINEKIQSVNMSVKKFLKYYTYNFKENYGDSIGIKIMNEKTPLYDKFYFRNVLSSTKIQSLMLYFVHSLQNFTIADGISKRTYENLIPENRINYSKEHATIDDCYDAFKPVILYNPRVRGMEYSLSLLTGNYCYKNDNNLITYQKGEQNKNPKYFQIEYDRDGYTPIRGGYLLADVKGSAFDRESNIPEFYFPSLKKELNNELIDVSQKNIVMQFDYLTDKEGVSAAYLFIDKKSLNDIDKIKAYKIYANK
jgi:hypothetical protein